MTSEQEYKQLTEELTRARSQYDATRGAYDAAMDSIKALYPEVTNLGAAEALLLSLQKDEDLKREQSIRALAEFRSRFPGTGSATNRG